MRNKETIQVFLILLVGVMLIFGFSHIGAITFGDYKEDVFKEGTIIGSVDVSGLTRDAATELLTKEFNVWKKGNDISILMMEEERKVSTETFTPNLTKSVKQAVDGEINPLIVKMNDKLFGNMILDLYGDLKSTDIDEAKLKQDLLEIPSTMQTGQFSFNIIDYSISGMALSIIADETIKIEPNQITELIGEVGESFTLNIDEMSQVSILNEFSTLSEEHLNTIGNILYKAILRTNFQVIERHISKHAPEQSELGYDTKIKRDEMDFIFHNPNMSQYVAQFTLTNSEIAVQLKGAPLLYEYSIEIEKKSFNPKSIVQMDPKLSLGTVKVIEKGEKGYLVEVTRSKKSKNGEILDKELIAEDFYPPVHQVILSSIISKETTEDVEEDVSTVEYDESGQATDE